MPFEEVTTRIAALPDKKPVAIRLNPTVGKPSCVLSVRKMVACNLKFEAGDSIGIAFGTGVDDGKLRLTIKGPQLGIAPIHALKTGAFSVHLGFVERFGVVPKAVVALDAVVVDDKTIDITLPNWDEVPAYDAEGEPGDVDGDPETAELPEGGAAAPDKEEEVEETPVGAISRQGVVITVDPPAIKHDGNTLPLQPTQQRLLAILLPSIELGPIPGKVVAQKMGASEEATRLGVERLQALLGRVDLSIELVKGIGYALKKI